MGGDDLGFSYRATADGRVFVERGGRRVAVLAGERARRFLAAAPELDAAGVQKALARLTGNYRRGNEPRGGGR